MPNFTRKAIMEAFFQLLDERPLNKVTIKDIVETCGVNRNTFYYHFQDIPALIEAIVKEEADLIVKKYASVSSYEECMNIAVEFILKNRRATLHVYNSANRDILEHYLMQICQYVVETYLNAAFHDRRVSEEDRRVIVICCKCQCFGLFIDWLNSGLQSDIQPTIQRICALREGMIEEMFARGERALSESEAMA